MRYPAIVRPTDDTRTMRVATPPAGRHARKYRQRVIAVALLALPALDATAASPPPRQPASAACVPTLPVQVVTARTAVPRPFDLPAMLDVIDLSEAGRDTPGIGPGPALRGVPGVLVGEGQDLARGASVSIRGFGARAAFGIRGVRLVVDGIPATSPDGQGQLSHAVFGTAGRIEILRGPFTALYAHATGGLIRISTAEGQAPASSHVTFGVGSYGLAHAAWGASGRKGPLAFRVGIDRTRTGGERRHASAEQGNGLLRLDWQRSRRQRLTLVVNRFDQPRAQDPQGLTRAQFDADPQQAAPSALTYDTRKRVRQTQAGLTLHQQIGSAQTLRASMYAGRRRVRQFLSVPLFVQARPGSSGGVIDLDGPDHGIDLRWQWRGHADALPWAATVGYGDQWRDVHRRGYDNFIGPFLGVQGVLRRDEHDIARSQGLFALLTFDIAPRWSISAGARRSRVMVRVRDAYITPSNPDDSGKVRFAATTPVAGLMFRASRHWHLYASWGRAFETPTVAELAYRTDGSAGLNPGLRPARTAQAEVGAKWRGEHGARADLALYGAHTGNAIGVDTSRGGRTTYRNLGTSRRRGLDVSWRWPISSRWHVAVAASVLQARVIAGGRTTPLPGVPRQRVQLAVDRVVAQGWQVGLQMQASASRTVNDAGTARAPGFATASLRADRNWRVRDHAVTVFLRLDNLFDRRYVGAILVNQAQGRYYLAGPGRSVYVGVRWRHGGSE